MCDGAVKRTTTRGCPLEATGAGCVTRNYAYDANTTGTRRRPRSSGPACVAFVRTTRRSRDGRGVVLGVVGDDVDPPRGGQRSWTVVVPSIPVEGGSCSDYDYVCGDPINNEDLNGTACGKRDRADKLVWEVKTQGIRANLRCGDAAGGWRHIKARGHVASLGWSDDFFKWAMQQTLKGGTATRTSPYNRWQFSGPIWQVFYDGSGNAYRREYDFTVITAKGGYVITAYGNYRGTVQCANPYCRGG